VTDNTVTDNTNYGIYLVSSGSCELRDNAISGSKYNFGVSGNSLAEYTQDIDTTNTVDGKKIYYWVDRSYDTIPSDAGYVGVVDSDHITVEGLTLSNNYNGVLFVYTTDSVIEDVTVSFVYSGIYLYYSTSSTVVDCTVADSSYGINMYYSASSTVTGNTVMRTTSYGIYLSYSGPSTVTDNVATYCNNYGVYLTYSSTSTVTGNTVTNNNYGMYIYRSTSSTVTGNMLKENTYGIYLYSSSGSSFHHNNFVDNTKQLYGTGSSYTSCTWDDGSGHGNYWSDYAGLDDGSGGRTAGDGIGDTALPHQGVDYYPYMAEI